LEEESTRNKSSNIDTLLVVRDHETFDEVDEPLCCNLNRDETMN